MFRWVFAALLLAAPATASDLPETLRAEIGKAQEMCREIEDGSLTLRRGALTRADLVGDGSADNWVLDQAYFDCSSAASLYCGSGGCGVFFAVRNTSRMVLAQGWALAQEDGRRVVWLRVHGSGCGGTNLDACFQKLVWNGQSFTLFPPQGG